MFLLYKFIDGKRFPGIFNVVAPTSNKTVFDDIERAYVYCNGNKTQLTYDIPIFKKFFEAYNHKLLSFFHKNFLTERYQKNIRVFPRRLDRMGFVFEFPSLEMAVNKLV
ncbi:hypothetical protein MXB_109 [Myxobolus squamalis]|nr:hypothetical protein MXB_109 [Myxobolus squamalis]